MLSRFILKNMPAEADRKLGGFAKKGIAINQESPTRKKDICVRIVLEG